MKILILGTGAYGLALATILADKNDVTAYSIIKEEIDTLKLTYKNETLFPNIEIPRKIKFTNDVDEAIKNIDLIIVAIPTKYIASTLNLFKGKINKNIKICSASKGINDETNLFASEIISEYIDKKNVYVLAGPSFAIDTIKKEKISLTLANNNSEFCIKNIFPNYIKIETTCDIVGVELSSTLKNIFAISCGILEGLGVSESTKSAYLTKIINETSNIIYKFNGQKQTILLSCGIGDIILTCSSKKSRNFTLGVLIGSKKEKKEIKKYLDKTTVEGLDAVISIKKLMKEKNIKSEIIDLIYNIILNDAEPNKLLDYIIK